MIISLVVDFSKLRKWHLELQKRAMNIYGTASIVHGRSHTSIPSAINLLIAMERLIDRRLSSPLAEAANPECAMGKDLHDADVVLLLDADHASHENAWRLLFDGEAGDPPIFAALLAGRSPVISVLDGSGAVRAAGTASLEIGSGLVGKYESVVARAMSLVLRALQTGPQPAHPEPRVASPPVSVVRFGLATLAHAIAHRLYRLCTHSPHWRVGWRRVGQDDVWRNRHLGGTPWQVLRDPGIRFFADPFPIVQDGRRFVFVEDFDHRSNKAVISCTEISADGVASRPICVLEESCHLSYPFILRHNDNIWMIPETSEEQRVSLYRAAPFPHRWVREADLLTGVEASDATLRHHDGLWWMFTTVRDGWGAHSDMLHLYWAENLSGPWRPHAGNPVLVDRTAARPAGPLVERDGELWRPAQDCSRGYGSGLSLVKIKNISPSHYDQAVHHTIFPNETWPGRRLHTLSRDGDLECIDGSAISWRLSS